METGLHLVSNSSTQISWNHSRIDKQAIMDKIHENIKNKAKKENGIKCYESLKEIEWILEGSRYILT